MTYDLGGVAVLTFTATDTAGAPANATLCQLTITQPDGTIVTGAPITLTGTAGVYSYNFVTVQSGRHTYRFLATGTPGPGVGVGAYDDVFDVYPASPATLISLADAKQLLRLSGTTQFDADLRYFNEAVTGIIDKYCGPVVPRQITERVRAGGMMMMLRQVPVYQPASQTYALAAMTPVLTYGLVYDLSQLTVDMTNGEIRHKAGLPFIYGPYDITYWAGRAVVSTNIQLAAQVILKHLWALERPSTRPGSGAGSGAADDVTVLWGFAIPNRAIELMEADRAPAGVA